MNNPWIEIAGDSDVNDLCKQMTEIEKEMEELHQKIEELVNGLSQR